MAVKIYSYDVVKVTIQKPYGDKRRTKNPNYEYIDYAGFFIEFALEEEANWKMLQNLFMELYSSNMSAGISIVEKLFNYPINTKMFLFFNRLDNSFVCTSNKEKIQAFGGKVLEA